MFDVGWSEMLVIAVVAVVVVGPKDLPRMLRTFGNYAGKARRVANDFRRQFDEAIREAELDDVKKSVEEISRIDPLAEVKASFEPAGRVGEEIKAELEKPSGDTPAEPKPDPTMAPMAVAAPAPQAPPAATGEPAEAKP